MKNGVVGHYEKLKVVMCVKRCGHLTVKVEMQAVIIFHILIGIEASAVIKLYVAVCHLMLLSPKLFIYYSIKATVFKVFSEIIFKNRKNSFEYCKNKTG